MNISPSTSTIPAVSVTPGISEQPVPQVSGQVKLVSNSVENLSSFERLLEQTFPEVILIKILRMLHPTRQVDHPWQHLLPRSYSLLLQHSAGLTNEENTYALLDAFSVIPGKWQPDAINAISENFIKRINNFNTFIAIVDFIIANNTLDSHAFGLLLTQLTEIIGRFTSSDIIPQTNRNVLTNNHSNSEEMLVREEKNIQLETKLQKAQSILFFHKVRKVHWDIKYSNVKNATPENSALINRMRPTFVVAAKRYNDVLLKINLERDAFHAAHCVFCHGDA
ncbi:hypothetical protein SC171_27780 [Pantoea cypripedii]|uniref:hypothetical protein n=1 Tax=Pantoea cypripedii TaxID=55209 RepID=UPI002FC9D21B